MNTNFPREWKVPRHRENIFFERRRPYALVVPVINEGERIGKQLREMAAAGIPDVADILVADGGSGDGSLPEEILGPNGVCALLVKDDSGRLSAQLRMAYAWALVRGYDGIITIDGNGKDSVSSIPLFAEALRQGVDYAQASRFLPGGAHRNTPLGRLLAIRLLHAPLVSLAARHWFTDTTQGFRAYSRQYLMDPRLQPFRDCFSHYELLVYLSVRATRLGYTAREIPTTRLYPAQGAVPTKIQPVSGALELLKVLFAACTGAYNP